MTDPDRAVTAVPAASVPAAGAVPASRGHPAGALGIIHPFPSVLVALAVGALAAVAGGSPGTIVTLAVAMFGFQASIGATNDLVDLAHDRVVGAAKPLPAGQISIRTARVVAVVGGLTGLVLSATVGLDVLLVGAAGFACGLGYDLWLRTRGLGWVAYLAAIPLLLLYAWLGAAGVLPPSWPLLLIAAAAVGPALHLANSFVDVDTDPGDPAGGLAGRLGRRRALFALALLLAVIYGVAWTMVATEAAGQNPAGATVTSAGASSASTLAVVGMIAATVLATLGVALSARPGRKARASGWAVQATATALLGVSCLASMRA